MKELIQRCNAVAVAEGRTLYVARYRGEPWLCDGTVGIRIPSPASEPRGIKRFTDADQKTFDGVMSALSPDYRMVASRSAARDVAADDPLRVYMLEDTAVSCVRYELVQGIWPRATWRISGAGQHEPVFALIGEEPVAVVMPVRIPRPVSRAAVAVNADSSERALWAENMVSALMAAGLAAVEQARKEERERCAAIAAQVASEQDCGPGMGKLLTALSIGYRINHGTP